MRIFFNHNIKGAFKMLDELRSQIPLLQDFDDNSTDDSWSFSFKGVRFLIVYDRYSEKNEIIPNFSITSYAADEIKESEQILAVTKDLYKKLKGIEAIYNLFSEE